MTTRSLASAHARLLAIAAALPAATLAAQGTYAPFGTGCPGTAGRVPALSASGTHTTGGTTTLATRNARARSLGVLFAGTSRTRWGSLALPADLRFLGMPGCTLRVCGDAILPMSTDASGRASHVLRHRDNPALAGTHLYVQHLIVDPGADTPLEVVLSNAGDLRVGCGDGRKSTRSAGFKASLPAIQILGFPGMSIDARHTGQRWLACCSRFGGSRACRYEGRGTIKGSVDSFLIPAGLIGKVLAVVDRIVCKEIKRVTKRKVSCGARLGVTIGGLVLDGDVGVVKNGCSGGFTYTGSGALRFPGGVTGGGRASVHIKIPVLPDIRFGFDLSASGIPTGTWNISRNRLSFSMRVPSLRFRASFRIPVIKKRVSFDFTVRTPFLAASSPSIPLPRPPIDC